LYFKYIKRAWNFETKGINYFEMVPCNQSQIKRFMLSKNSSLPKNHIVDNEIQIAKFRFHYD